MTVISPDEIELNGCGIEDLRHDAAGRIHKRAKEQQGGHASDAVHRGFYEASYPPTIRREVQPEHRGEHVGHPGRGRLSYCEDHQK